MRVEGGSVDDVPARSLLRHQAGMGQFLEMERQGVRRDSEPLGHRARRQAGSASDDQGSKDLKPYGLCQCCERLDDVFFFHSSILVEA